ncbi:hypothetical protein ACWDWU_49620 [Streptomyces sp. NPDC003442]
MSLAVVRKGPLTPLPETLEKLEPEILAEPVFARAAVGLSDRTTSSEVTCPEQTRAWFGRSLRDLGAEDAVLNLGMVLSSASRSARLGSARSIGIYFLFLGLRYRTQVRSLTGRPVECPVDGPGPPADVRRSELRPPPSTEQMRSLSAGRREELATCRKRGLAAARNHTACRLRSELGLRIGEVCALTLSDIRWGGGPHGERHISQRTAP